MHEGAIVHSLLELAKEIREKENLKDISQIKIVVGKFHQIIEEVMQTNFAFMKTEYAGFENASLKISVTDVKVRCQKCQHEFCLDEPIFMCPQCDSFETELISGKELYIQSIEGSQ
jgi:hydrogenase nickel incorporation protein HypA/HybF